MVLAIQSEHVGKPFEISVGIRQVVPSSCVHQPQPGLNATKEAIGDAIRNAAMRFGVALDLWAKDKPQVVPTPPKTSPEERKTYLVEIDSTDTVNELRDLYSRITARVSDETIREELKSRITKRAKGLEALEAKNAKKSAAPEEVNA